MLRATPGTAIWTLQNNCSSAEQNAQPTTAVTAAATAVVVHLHSAHLRSIKHELHPLQRATCSDVTNSTKYSGEENCHGRTVGKTSALQNTFIVVSNIKFIILKRISFSNVTGS